MNKWRIVINNKLINIFEGKNEDDALNNYAISEGYKSWRVMQYNNPELESGVKVINVGKVKDYSGYRGDLKMKEVLSKKDLNYLASVNTAAEMKKFKIYI